MANYTFQGMDMNQLAVWFFIYSFCGWAMECIVIRIQLGYWENRGFAKMPFCVIYGFGIFIAYHIFAPFEHNYVAIYFAGCIAATIFEYLTAQLMLRLFGTVWWNYEHKKFNYKGILCLESTLAWGVLALFVFGIFNRFVEEFVLSIDNRYAAMLGLTLSVSYMLDFSYHFIRGFISKNDIVGNTISELKRNKNE
jgi:uncharacterized membrane protein